MSVAGPFAPLVLLAQCEVSPPSRSGPTGRESVKDSVCLSAHIWYVVTSLA
jgi:hypothetical protein